jgi:predicted component of type VI protein secretion system
METLIGRMLMKTLIKAFAVLLGICLGSSIGYAQQASDVLTRIQSLKTEIQTQIERIKTYRGSTDNQLSLARLRIGEQIRRSEQDLAVQLERLQRLRDQMKEQTGQAEQTVTRMKTDLSTLSTTALSDIETQLSQTIDLLSRMRRIREEVTGETDSGAPVVITGTDTTLASTPPLVTPDPEPAITPAVVPASSPPSATPDPEPVTTPAVAPAPTPSGGG